MVKDDVVFVALPGGISSIVYVLFLSTTETDEPDDIVVSGAHREIANGDAGVGGSLSCNSSVVADYQFRGKSDDTGNIEDNDFLVVTAHGSTKRTCAAIVEIGYMNNLAAASARHITSVTFGSGECWNVVSKGRCTREGRGHE